MGSAIENGAANVAAPKQGSIRVLGLTTTASATQDISDLMGGTAPNKAERWVTFYCDVLCYITHNSSSTITNPDPALTTGNGRTWPLAAGVEKHYRITNDTKYFKAIVPTATGTLRWVVSENKP